MCRYEFILTHAVTLLEIKDYIRPFKRFDVELQPQQKVKPTRFQTEPIWKSRIINHQEYSRQLLKSLLHKAMASVPEWWERQVLIIRIIKYIFCFAD